PLFLPTYTATAWFHGKLSGFSSLKDALMESEAFAGGEYLIALAQGDLIPVARKTEIAHKLSRLTGLSPQYVESTNLRVEIFK
ncbi:peptidase S10, partial [Pseudomonas sp. GW704-F2]